MIEWKHQKTFLKINSVRKFDPNLGSFLGPKDHLVRNFWIELQISIPGNTFSTKIFLGLVGCVLKKFGKTNEKLF